MLPKSRKDRLKIALSIAGMTTMLYTTIARLRSLPFPPDLWLLQQRPALSPASPALTLHTSS
ncbi:hypothetical protein M441DRAFT_57043 [Trichoderma asperellum CBS 433.97]|uniref:Uncharacterized protein n=1 Tax=Trichoderma asperellum (strain ATCC 204424 / CBS 433.97 / NBRC 101777) TaxID=1042311 RepID=A0A2T3ZBU8_TRIA4|nr:hypothetical protein M441DRAFT_57043 [Trichoderma asperellum CBS 433.97]PTB42262.1 hypothetical protein M441DRAFT_57043 [Trichoderma asperellum CBS 433.97]